MSAFAILRAAHERGLKVELADDRLHIVHRGPLPGNVREALLAAKPEIIRLLTPDASGENGQFYWQAYEACFADRTACGVPAEPARVEAYDLASRVWLERSFMRIEDSAQGRHCAHCGREADSEMGAFLPLAHARAWVHDNCFDGWRRRRQQQTVDALAAYGLHAPQAWRAAQAEREAYEQAVVAAWGKRPFRFTDNEKRTKND